MNHCAKCSAPITPGQEVWARRKNGKQRAALCPSCATAVRQKAKPGQTQPAAPGLLDRVEQSQSATQRTKSPAMTRIKTTSSQVRTKNNGSQPKTYKPSNKTSIDGVLMLILITMVGGVLIGGITAVIGRFIYLIIAFPVGMGYLGGKGIELAVKHGKVRNPLLAATFGLLVGFIIYGTYRYGEYLFFRIEGRTIIMEEVEMEGNEPIDATTADLIADEILLEETGYTGFLGFTLLQAAEGMSIGRVSGGTTINIGTTLTWIYWVVEILLVFGFAAMMGSEAASRPFCERHDRWYGKEKRVGGLSPDQGTAALQLLKDGNFLELGPMLESTAPLPGVELYVERCRDCIVSNPVLTVKRVFKNSKGKIEHKELHTQIISQDQMATLQQSML